MDSLRHGEVAVLHLSSLRTVCSHQEGDTGYSHHLEEIIRKNLVYVTLKQEPLTLKWESQQVTGATVHWLCFHVLDTKHKSSHCSYVI